MMSKLISRLSVIEFSISTKPIKEFYKFIRNHAELLVVLVALDISWIAWFYFFGKGYHLAYNDAMSHLDIARRVVDNLTPGVAQLGSVWLPLLHVLMLPTIWIDSFWQMGLSAALVSMGAFVLTVVAIYKSVWRLSKNRWAALLAALLIVTNTNFLYLQTTALTEPLFMALFSWVMYHLIAWVETKNELNMVLAAGLVTLSTLTRYDGWALLGFIGLFLFGAIWWQTKRWSEAEGWAVLFGTLAGFGVLLWFGWNLLIFGDPLYFATGEFSAKAQQDLLAAANDLPTKGNVLLSIWTYTLAMINNVGPVSLVLAILGWLVFMYKHNSVLKRALGLIFLAPVAFNVLALFLGHSVIHLPELTGDTWFNVRYGLLVLPTAAVFIAYLTTTQKWVWKYSIALAMGIQTLFFFSSRYAVTIDDGLWGASQKNVKAIGAWINQNVGPDEDGLVLVSAASHDAILFSSGLPMRRFIHEGTGEIWKETINNPAQNATYVIMRTHDKLDLVSRKVEQLDDFFESYELIYDDEFADVYRLREGGAIQASRL